MATSEIGGEKRGRKLITDTELKEKWAGKDKWLPDAASRGAGRLVARLTRGGWVFYFRYQGTTGERRVWRIALYDSKSERGKTLKDARAEAHKLSELHREIGRDLHEYFEEKQKADEAALKAAEAARTQAEAAAKQSTLRELCEAYSGHLERREKQSAGDVRRIFERNVYDAAPDLAGRRASEISMREFVGLINKLTTAGKGRTAAKLRSYLRAAYSLAIKSASDPAAPLAMQAFGIEANPLADISALSEFSLTRDRHLSDTEMGAFLRKLEATPASIQKDALALCVLLGGQRPTQLLRLKPVDVDTTAGTITLHDTKGSRKQPRLHILPLVGKAAPIMKRLVDGLADEAKLIFSGDGERQLREETVSGVVTDICAAMMAADPREARERFELRDLRRTAETMMAALKIPSDIRAQIQSHGLGGVQARHYDRHSYADEKRAALAKWQRHLEKLASGESAKVVSIAARRKA